MHTSTTSTVPLQPWTAEQLQQATQGEWFQHNIPQGEIKRILTDSRHAEAGDAFLALKGERFDAHNFVAQVANQGCQIAIVEHPIDADIAQLIVKDTRLALGQLGAYRRQQNSQLKVIALTGSSGKTTTKEMLGSILSGLAPTLITRGNLNNDLGVPMMLLELRPEHQYAVMELGASHQGEIDYTSNLVQPHVAGILNIGTAHLGEFGGREGICRAKSEIYAHILPEGIAIVPAQDDFSESIRQNAQAHSILSFGEGGDVFATEVQLHPQSAQFNLHTPQGVRTVNLPFAGAHNVQNAAAATAFALALGVALDDIVQGLEQAQGAKGRLNFIQHQNHLFIDDTYNANPTSMRAAAQVLLQQQGLKVMVMGDIGELGDSSWQEHHDLGKDLATLPLDQLIVVGEFAAAAQQGSANAAKLHAFASQKEALPFLINLVQTHQPQSMSFLFKGSRYTHMETLMADLMEKI
ncbi:UDP-N-acetylmuramoyl-tripeptide--D-alanyl-D-alanine ligase [Acinetobacter proteolyticus]|jgi:UDP-N-acetylmuramoyl-tripeptide--D-alanyl-D-alanine ligase|uniref:UDP-N-acetylmuramoyl-tripeptide--D-alanyl-D-alanine ligase n=1 Tax=Acinetobacter proteolyticus TaxID=1776741 RepID=A0A653K7J1_9GAMM|nr:UDP-N-acetylmuramoyl-tripeptide--D-alanyl-D-alanine ligase [Acinetobacter proteolyticus]OEY93547.1 UDP-N-acetylmuramoyl-tripeptide--D-alanyl-D-alanine ligase [Acinetobacter proteolyticus]QHH93856.1 UDP-N-acetylmuramoyl-tripeptide--D-alanyl-D-alanine ligase [Acinetobacter gyllenbergii]VXA56600.1 UDP-N-acetylmuramoyl-tripeptide--D-alanyl-D-alanine ligase (UDP-MurNAc-pentapeptide synthetase) (D-alanyl-D-alanine-adding enzyme) [Acinetobacter proteolyticus]